MRADSRDKQRLVSLTVAGWTRRGLASFPRLLWAERRERGALGGVKPNGESVDERKTAMIMDASQVRVGT